MMGHPRRKCASKVELRLRLRREARHGESRAAIRECGSDLPFAARKRSSPNGNMGLRRKCVTEGVYSIVSFDGDTTHSL